MTGNPENFIDSLDSYLERPKSSVCPILGNKAHSAELLGSGVLISAGSEKFLLTAAHVLDYGEYFNLQIPGQDFFIPLNGHFSFMKKPPSGKRDDDVYDVGYVRLNEETINNLHPDLTFLNATDADLHDKTSKGDVYTVIGFPITKSTIRQRRVETSQYCFSGEGTDANIYSLVGVNINHHLIVRYRRKRGISYKNHLRVFPPDFNGISGGGVFAWSKRLPDLKALAQPKLVAILTEHHRDKSFFLATRIECFIRCIQLNNPGLPIKVAPPFPRGGKTT